LFGQLRRSPLGESMPSAGKNEAGGRDVVVLTQHEVGSEVVSGPRLEQRWRIWAEVDEQVAQLSTLECVEQDLRHVTGP
jgi:hypothetical protein